jgi:hypothetical protein
VHPVLRSGPVVVHATPAVAPKGAGVAVRPSSGIAIAARAPKLAPVSTRQQPRRRADTKKRTAGDWTGVRVRRPGALRIAIDRPGMEARSAPIEDGRALIDAIAGAFGWSVTIDRADPAPPQVDHPQAPEADAAD